jgi:16S rRNA (guanine527-N7)-methyltransferase
MDINSKEWKALLVEGAATLGITIGTLQAEQMAVHGAELLKWNRKVNLTAIVEPVEVAVKHFIDAIVPVMDISPCSKLLDMGSGGGFPGLPLKVVAPELSVTLIDSSRKKVSFQNHIIRTLGLSGIEAIHTRAETFASVKRCVYDVVICRAFSDFGFFLKMAHPFLKPEGIMVAMKGKYAVEEIQKAGFSKKGGHQTFMEKEGSMRVTLKEVTLPYLNLKRTIAMVRACP